MSRRLHHAIVPALVLSMACTDRAPTALAPTASNADRHATTDSASVSVVMSNLSSPRGLAFDPSGALYVAESGTSAVNGACVTTPRGETCYSGTGAVSRLRKGKQSRILSGLPSIYNRATLEATGPHDISFLPNGNGFLTIGLGMDPALRSSLGSPGQRLGGLLRFTSHGQLRHVADIAAFEQQQNPAGGPFDSNPFGVLAERTGRYVTDAGGNSLLRIAEDISTVTTFAPIPVPPGPFNPPFTQSDPVPTDVVRGPDGALYVSTLTGAPFLPGAASIYRVAPGQLPSVHAGGFTAITDFAIGDDGSLYVLQYASAPFLAGNGSVVRVAPDGTRSTVINTLENPTGIVVGAGNVLYVSNRGLQPGAGEVLRIVPAP